MSSMHTPQRRWSGRPSLLYSPLCSTPRTLIHRSSCSGVARPARTTQLVVCQVEGVEPLPQAAKFRPFVAQSPLRQRVLEFQRTIPCDDGVLVIQPIKEAWVRETAEILTEGFADSMGYLQAYKNYLRRQIAQYLLNHIDLPPKTVILVATLLKAPPAGSSDGSSEERGQQPSASQGSACISSSSGSDSGGNSGGSDSSGNGSVAAFSSSSWREAGQSAGSSAAAEAGPEVFTISGEEPLQEARQPGSESPGMQLQLQQGQEQGQGQGQGQLQEEESSLPWIGQEQLAPPPMEFPAPFSQASAADQLLGEQLLAGLDDTSSSEGESEAASMALPSSSSSGSGDGSWSAGPENGVVVGVVEVSFTESTRTKHLTLNPPKDRPYLCNMAVAAEHRGRGLGTRIMAAAEELVQALGESEIYLHVRVEDEGAARLYRRAGFKVLLEDAFWLVLLGMDRRRLLRKRLARPGDGAGGL